MGHRGLHHLSSTVLPQITARGEALKTNLPAENGAKLRFRLNPQYTTHRLRSICLNPCTPALWPTNDDPIQNVVRTALSRSPNSRVQHALEACTDQTDARKNRSTSSSARPELDPSRARYVYVYAVAVNGERACRVWYECSPSQSQTTISGNSLVVEEGNQAAYSPSDPALRLGIVRWAPIG